MTIAVIHLTKGGAGKTTLATNISVEFARRGYKPTLVDFDIDQGASTHFIKKRDKEDISLLKNPTPKEIQNIVKTDDVIVFDTGGYDNSTTQAVMMSSDLVLIPVLNNEIETNAFVKLSEKLYKAVKITNKQITPFIVPCRIHSAISKKEIKDYFAPLSATGYLVTDPIYYRLAYQKAFDDGLGVVEYKDKKAQTEIYNLVNTILGEV